MMTTPKPINKNLARLKEVWREASSDHAPIVEYLVSRGLPGDVLGGVSPDALCFHSALEYWEYDEHDKLVCMTYPAIVAKVKNQDGRTVTLHRTYLASDFQGKAPVEKPKKLMKAVRDGATVGAAIRLFPAGSVLGLTEGMETALAVRAATGQTVWPCVSSGGLQVVVLPEEARAVHVWADNDKGGTGAGEVAALAAAERFRAEGRTVYLHLPRRINNHKTDWLDVYNTQGADALMVELAESTEWTPEDGPQVVAEENNVSTGVLLSSVAPESVEWLWDGRIPCGKLTVLDGDPGLGKSTAAADIAARVSTGQPMPDGSGGGQPAGVVLLSAEDGLADTIVPRLMAAGADLSRILALDACPDLQGEDTHPPVLPDDLPHIRAAIERVSAKLMIIDPLMAYLSGDTNSHRDQDIRRVLFRMATLAEETGVAVVVVRHLNKSSGGPALYRGGGSIGIIGAARSGLLVASDPDDESRRVLASTKSNLGAPPESLTFRLEKTELGVARTVWGGASSHNANTLLAMPSTDEEQTAVGEAKDFLRTVLTNGPISSKRVASEARDASISEKTLRRAKAVLGVVSTKTGMGGGWVWALPEGGQEDPKVANPERWASSGEVGHLRESEPETRGSDEGTAGQMVVEI